MPADLTQFKQKLILRDQTSFDGIVASIEQIKAFDKKHERLHRIITILAWLAFAVAVGAVIASFAGQAGLIPVAILGGIVWCGGYVFLGMSGQNDLSNRRYELLREVTNLLSRDMPNDGRFDLVLDLAPANHKRKKSKEDQVAGWKVTYFEDPWLQLEGRLVDGTSFKITITERTQARKKWAQSRSGKSKLKTKSKSTTVAAVTLFPKQKKFSNLGQVVNQAKSQLRLPSWVQTKKMIANEEKLSVTTTTNANWSVMAVDPKTQFNGSEMIVGSLLSLYQVLHLSKATSPK